VARIEPILIKLGGSVATFRERPLAANREAIEGVARSVASCGSPVVLVHGGGSFGHHYASMYGLGTTSKVIRAEACSKIHNAMLELDLIITKILVECGVANYSLPPVELIAKERVTEYGITILKDLIVHRVSPVTFGDVLPSKKGFFILSGDVIARLVAVALKARRVFFLLDVDGIFPSRGDSGNVISELDWNTSVQLFRGKGWDVTGGLATKIQEAFKIAKAGIDVFFVNGLKPDRVLKALKGQQIYGTRIRGVKGGS